MDEYYEPGSIFLNNDEALANDDKKSFNMESRNRRDCLLSNTPAVIKILLSKNFYDNGVFNDSMVKSWCWIGFEAMTESGIIAESAYFTNHFTKHINS